MFEQYLYLLGLIGAITCLALADKRFKLVFARDAKRAAKTLSFGYLLFFVWDVLGIKLQIFFIGPSRFMTHLQIIKNFMVEELFFIALLVYVPLILWEGLKRYDLKKRGV